MFVLRSLGRSLAFNNLQLGHAMIVEVGHRVPLTRTDHRRSRLVDFGADRLRDFAVSYSSSEPRVHGDLRCGHAIAGFVAKKASDETSAQWRHVGRNRELGATNFAEQKRRRTVMERIPANHEDVGDNSEWPEVSSSAGVRSGHWDDLGADVGRTAVLIIQEVVGVVLKHYGVFETIQGQAFPAVIMNAV